MSEKQPYSMENSKYVGGQAVMEGVMMRGPKNVAVCVRKSNGELVVEKQAYQSYSKKYKLLGLPILRGIVGFFESMILGMKTLMQSANYYDIEASDDESPSKIDKFFERIFGDKLQEIMIYFALAVSLFLSVGLFVFIPNFFANLIFKNDKLWYNIFEGILRLVIFLIYLFLVSRMKDIQRVFEFHGAEHKTIHCYENEQPLCVENVKKYSVLHPRCGTSFLLVVMVVSIFVFSFIWHDIFIYNLLMRISLLPLVAGISYEIIKLSSRKDSWFSWLNVGGMCMQKLTTREPDDSQIEVAIAALKSAIEETETDSSGNENANC